MGGGEGGVRGSRVSGGGANTGRGGCVGGGGVGEGGGGGGRAHGLLVVVVGVRVVVCGRS